jgi:hypothetical protein
MVFPIKTPVFLGHSKSTFEGLSAKQIPNIISNEVSPHSSSRKGWSNLGLGAIIFQTVFFAVQKNF